MLQEIFKELALEYGDTIADYLQTILYTCLFIGLFMVAIFVISKFTAVIVLGGLFLFLCAVVHSIRKGM